MLVCDLGGSLFLGVGITTIYPNTCIDPVCLALAREAEKQACSYVLFANRTFVRATAEFAWVCF